MRVIDSVQNVLRGLLQSRFPVISSGIGLLFLFASSATVPAQDLPDVAQGVLPYTSYHGGELDKVSTVNGGLTVRIPLVSYPQKGSLALSYSVIFNSFGFQDLARCASSPPGSVVTIPAHNGCTNRMELIPTGLPSLFPLSPRLIADQTLLSGGSNAPESPGVYQTPIDARFYIIESDNAQHPLGAASDGFRSLDETGYYFIPASPPQFGTNIGFPENAYPGDTNTQMSAAPGTITDSHGLVYTANSITDPDGNTISLPMSVGGSFSGLPATDSTGRNIPQPGAGDISQCPTLANAQYQPLASAALWTPPGSGSGYLFCYANVNIYTHIPLGFGSSNTQFHETVQMLQSIVLPNGTYWGFIYDSNNPNSNPTPTLNNVNTGLGQLMTLIYPTGGSVSYTYGQSGGFCSASRISETAPAAMIPFIPQVLTRTMSPSASDAQPSVPKTWSYTYPPDANGDFTGSITSPTGDVTVTYFTSDGSACGIVDGGQDIYQGAPGSGTLLKSTRTTYTDYINLSQPSGQPLAASSRPTLTTTTLNDGSTSTVQTAFGATINIGYTECDYTGSNCVTNLTQTLPIGGATSTTYTGYDGSVMKSNSTAYAWQSIPVYRSANLLGLPSQTSTLDGSGNTIETTNYTYDESAYAPGETTVRGHLTTASKTLNMASGPAPTTHTGWNTSGTAAGEKAYSIDANGNTTSYGYGACDGSVVTSTTNALNQTISGGYDCNTGLLTSLIDLNGNTTSVSWDAMRRITQVTYPAIPAGTPTTSFNYQDSTNTVTKTVAASPDPAQTTTVVFDSFGREQNRYNSDGSSAGQAEVDTDYDPTGQVASVTNPYHTGDTIYSTSTTYDALSRPLVVTKPDSINFTTTSYNGPTTDSWDENNTHMQHTTDALGRLVKVMELGTQADPRSLETDYTYDTLNSLTYVNQHGAAGETPRIRSFTYDSLARLITSTNPETGTICYGTWNGGSCQNGYDANGNLLAKTDANGVITSYSYEQLNRLTSKSSSDGSLNDQYAYDLPYWSPNPVGRLSYSVVPSMAGNIFFYDALGHITGGYYYFPNLGWQYGPSTVYDLAGSPTSITYPDGRNVAQTFDAGGRLTSATDTGSSTAYFSSALYTAAGALSSATYGNGVTEGITYNSRLQPCHTLANSPALAPISGVGNVYDRVSSYANSLTSSSPCNAEAGNNGNIAYIADNHNIGWTQSFGYDGLNRLTSASRSDGGYNHIYNYDSFGNLLVQDNLNPNPTYSINSATNQLNRLVNNVNIYNYDAAGNLLSSGTSDIGGHSFTYNALSQITAVDGGTTGSYSYNAMDQRDFKQTASGWTEYVYFGGQPMAEYTSAGVWTDYIYAEGQKISKIAAGATNYYLDDHLGTTQVELDASGNLTWQGQFTPFGAELNDGSTTMHYKFTGKERDTESGLDYFGARYYASNMGRWMSPDWAQKPEAVPYSQLANPQSLNLYGYVNNNPLSKADPDGHAPDILVIEDGPTQGNPIGHTAIAVTGRGVYSFGTNTPLGSSTTDFLQMESGRRNQTVTVIKTTPEQDQAAVNELTKQNDNGSINLYPDNCASRTNAALDAAGVPQKTYSTPVAEVPAQDTSMPGTAGSRAQATPGSQTTVIPQGGAVPSNLNQFNPKPNQPPPPVEKKTPNTAGSSS